MKKELIQSLKIIIFGIVVTFGMSYLLAWTGPPANPPANNIDAPINVGINDQIKGGGNSVGSLLHINGSLSSNSLAVFGPATISDNLTVDYLKGGGNQNICVNTLGVLVVCAVEVPPQVLTNSVSAITQTTAKSGGEVTSEGGSGSVVVERGVVWVAGAGTPTVTSSLGKLKDASGGVGTFVSNITGLAPSTPYTVRAYATNNANITVYGDPVVFTTLSVAITLPVVTTNPVEDITGYTATGGGSVTAGTGLTITAKGLQFSVGTNNVFANLAPTTSGSGSFTTPITGLTVNSDYVVRAYAITDKAGTIYGSEIKFSTIGGTTCGGYSYANYCWYFGDVGQSCNTVCSKHAGCNPTSWADGVKVPLSDISLIFKVFGITGSLGYTGFNVQPAVWWWGGASHGVYGTSSSPSTCSTSAGEYRRLCACME